MRSRSNVVTLFFGVVVGALLMAAVLFAQPASEVTQDTAEGTWRVYDTATGVFLVDTEHGHLWRVGHTEVKGDRFWFGSFVPKEERFSFESFREKLRRKMKGER